MKKTVLILNGSPRPKGNTRALVDAFTAGLEKAGHEVTEFCVGQMEIHPCAGCLLGGTRGGLQSPCVQKDDMDKIYPLYGKADVIVLASPMYSWYFTAQLKTAIDRLYAYTEANNHTIPQKECMMLITSGASYESNREPLKAYYASFLQHMRWTDRGSLFAGGVFRLGDIEGKPVLQDAYQLGAGLC